MGFGRWEPKRLGIVRGKAHVKLLRDSFPRVDETGSEAHPIKGLTEAQHGYVALLLINLEMLSFHYGDPISI